MTTQVDTHSPETIAAKRESTPFIGRLSAKWLTEKTLRLGFWLLAIVVGFLHVWDGRNSMNQDGVSYLDMGDAYFRGDWTMALNAYWSPLYAWLLGFVMNVFRPSPEWEFAVAHLVNFFVFLFAFGCFEFLLREVIKTDQERSLKLNGRAGVGLPRLGWLCFGYMLFLWATLYYIPLRLITPDVCVAALVFLASGLILRLRRGVHSWKLFVALGVTLALGYMAKAVMFPLAFVYLVVALFAFGNGRRAIPRVAVSLALFLLLSSPLIIALSITKGRLTFSDTGKITYAWFVNGVPVRHWQGEGTGSGAPIHPTRKLLDRPTLYEFNGPIGGTFPVWYDPSYWYEGVRLRFDLMGQAKATLLALGRYHRMFFSYLQSGLFIGFLVLLLYSSWRPKDWLRSIAAQWPLLAPALAAMLLYAVVYVEARYVGPFIILFWLGLYSAPRLPAAAPAKRVTECVAIVMTALLVILLFVSTAVKARFLALDVWRGKIVAPHKQWDVARGLQELGVHPGDKIATVYPEASTGSRSRMMATARLARVQVVAGITPRDSSEFWTADPATREQVINLFKSTGARIILSEDLPDNTPPDNWVKVGDTSYHAYFLTR